MEEIREYVIRFGERTYGPYTPDEAWKAEIKISAYAAQVGTRAKISVSRIEKWED